MGRPKKVEDAAADEAVSVVDEMPIPANEPLKPCPRCGTEGVTPGLDPHGNWRCGCSACGFWDSMVYNSADEAAKGWQQAGGPNPEGFIE